MAAGKPGPPYAPSRALWAISRSPGRRGGPSVRQKGAVTGEHGATGQVFRAGDMSANGIDRLDVTAEAFGCARVEQREIIDLPRGEGRQRSVVEIVVQHRRIARWRRNRVGGHVPSRCPP